MTALTDYLKATSDAGRLPVTIAGSDEAEELDALADEGYVVLEPAVHDDQRLVTAVNLD